MRKVPLALLLTAACLDPRGSETPTAAGAGAGVVIVVGYTFQPQRLQVRPGSTVVVENHDVVPHQIVSATAAGSFTPGAAPGAAPFQTGMIPGSQVSDPGSPISAFAVPAETQVGAVLPYFCVLHQLPSEQGEVVVVAP